MDALAHCLEAYCAPGYHPMADGIAVEAMGLILEWLPRAVADGNDLEAIERQADAGRRRDRHGADPDRLAVTQTTTTHVSSCREYTP